MTKKLLSVVTLMLVVAFALMAADITGKWVAEQPGRNGGPPRQTTFDLKASGATLTGTMTGGMGGGPRRGGVAAVPGCLTVLGATTGHHGVGLCGIQTAANGDF